MNRNEWQKVKKIFDAALKLAPEKRGKFLDENCDEDKTLRREVENLLASFKDDSFMEQPAAAELASLIVKRNSKLTDGEQIAHYRILSQIGAGGMGEVYLAMDTRLHRKIALKILPAASINERDRVRRFEQEAFAASALNHPNILTIYEIGETADTRYIATEFIDGETLRDKLERDEMNLREILDVAGQTAFALSAAHAAGIVHRDIKPENIMLRADGIVKVLDFGLAKLSEPPAAASGLNYDNSEAETRAQVNTQAGMILGTVAYMSPEQARGKEIDARTDVWSLGVVLYEMLAGRVPFAGKTTSDTIAAILKSEPAPLQENAPAEFQRIIRKALQKNADERYQTVKDLLLDLKNLKRELEFSEELERSNIPSFAKTGNGDTARSNENATAIQPAAVSTQNNISSQTSSAEYVVGEVRKHKFVSLGVLTALIIALAVIGYFRFFAARPAVINSIAVLPFVNESGNADVEYLSDGMTETLISSLSQIPKLNVKARSSVFRYKGKDADAQTVGKELNVQAILNGTVVQRGQDLALHIELIDASTESVLWSEDYKQPLANLVSLQSEITRDVSSKLKIKLSGADERKLAKIYTENAEAYQLYLKGRYYWYKFPAKDFEKSRDYFQQAIDADPNFALAYVGLADYYGFSAALGILPPDENWLKNEAAAKKALELDKSLGETHNALAGLRLYYYRDWAAAEREFRRAIELSPNYAEAHNHYGQDLSFFGRSEEAVAEMKKAIELEPLSVRFNRNLARLFYWMRDDDRAVEQYRKTLELDPNDAYTRELLGYAYEQKGMQTEAVAEWSKALTLTGQNEAATILERAFAASGFSVAVRSLWQKKLEQLNERAKRGEYVPALNYALAHTRLADKEQAFVWLAKAERERNRLIFDVKLEPTYDSLRDDPRFQDLLRRVGLPQ